MSIELKELLYKIALVEHDNKNYNPKTTNNIILSLIKDNTNENNLNIELYSPTKKSTKEFLKNLGSYYKVKENNKFLKLKCSICLEQIKLNEYIRLLPKCEDFFHKKCIDKWFHKSSNKICPVCYMSFDYVYENCNNESYIKL